MEHEDEYESKYAHKPKKEHPWRHGVTTEVANWAKEKARVSGVNNVIVARPETLHKRDGRKKHNRAK